MYSVTIAADGSSRRAKLRPQGAEIWAASTIVNEIYMIFRDGLLCHLPIHPYDGFKEQYQKTGRQTGHGTASKSPLVFSIHNSASSDGRGTVAIVLFPPIELRHQLTTCTDSISRVPASARAVILHHQLDHCSTHSSGRIKSGVKSRLFFTKSMR